MEPFRDMAEFLRESRINKALTDRPIVYESHVRMFWKSARYEESTKMIHSVVQKKDENDKDVDIEFKFDVRDLRRVLDLGDNDEDPTIVPERLCKGLWFRMGFTGHANGKYLKPYNISQVIFDHMVDNIKGEKYIMYPRFIQMLIDDQVEDLPKDSEDELGLRHMTAETLGRLTQYKLKKDETEPRAKRMIYKINNRNYVAPENDAWRHENSNSENENDKLSGMHEKKLRYWFVKDGKRKRTPKVSPKISTPKIVVKGPSQKSPPRLVDEPVLDLADVIQQGVGLKKESLEGYLKKNEEATAAKDQSSSVEKITESTKNVQPESVKEKEPEGVAHTDSSDADDESTETESEIEKIGVGKVTLKKKPQKKKRKGSDDEDETYIPTPQVEKKKIIRKRKVVQTGVLPRSIRARKGYASVPEVQSRKSEKHVVTSKVHEAVKD
ncbi:hypothetical protein HanPI659440_Chr05g0207121 [Helianthus annuus]|nr:hypothetical protein HanPI659440_Chr05g0207121 [Helianthus annuus]